MKSAGYSCPKRYTIEKGATGRCEIIFCDNIKVCSNGVDEQSVVYKFDMYRLQTEWHPSLEREIEINFEHWLSLAKRVEYERLAAEVRARRNELLQESDSKLVLDRILATPIISGDGQEGILELMRSFCNALSGKTAKYRQALRDVPEQEGFPYNIIWPCEENFAAD